MVSGSDSMNFTSHHPYNNSHDDTLQHTSSPADISNNHVTKRGWGIYFLSGDAFLFLLIDCFTLLQLLKILQINTQRNHSIPPVSLTGGKTRTLFICLVFVANLVRAISLIVISYMESERLNGSITYPSYYIWEVYLIRSFPTLLFLSTYSVVILFWSQVYYAAILVSYPLLKPLSIFFNIAVYCMYIALSILTFLLKAFDDFVFYSTFVIGIVYCATSFGFAYFGIKVANKLSERSKEESRKNSIIKRVLFLSLMCPTVFLLRGIYSIAFAMQVIKQFYPHNVDILTWDALIYFVSEWIPSVFILVTFWHRKPQRQNRVYSPEVATPLMSNAYNPYSPQQRYNQSDGDVYVQSDNHSPLHHRIGGDDNSPYDGVSRGISEAQFRQSNEKGYVANGGYAYYGEGRAYDERFHPSNHYGSINNSNNNNNNSNNDGHNNYSENQDDYSTNISNINIHHHQPYSAYEVNMKNNSL